MFKGNFIDGNYTEDGEWVYPELLDLIIKGKEKAQLADKASCAYFVWLC
jgi:hypothetical protein